MGKELPSLAELYKDDFYFGAAVSAGKIRKNPEVIDVVKKHFNSITPWIEMTRDWFNALSKPGKVIVGICAVWLGFSALNTVFHLISSLLSLAILGVILYFVYTKFIANK